MGLALTAHLVLAGVLVRRTPTFHETPAAAHVPVVFVPPRPQIVPMPPPPPAPEAPAVPVPQVPQSGSPAPGAAAAPRPPDLVFVIDPPDHGDAAEPRVAGTAGVTLPEVAPESEEDARGIQEMARAGWVVLRVLVRRDGTVQEVVPGGGGDTEAAGRMGPAVRDLRFRPAVWRGRPVDAWFTMVWPPT
ncbi:MAG TPA: hypothetical protein VFV75_06715 [Candidatus Polarisedimenticolaceae bacterium]|nr:hypothetical protein [Candidatus Polarisedimenticolaceae bacterium]